MLTAAPVAAIVALVVGRGDPALAVTGNGEKTMNVKTISILGSTGSVGTQTLDLIRATPERYRVEALVAGRNVTLLAEQAREFRAEIAVIQDESSAWALREALAGTDTQIAAGADGGA